VPTSKEREEKEREGKERKGKGGEEREGRRTTFTHPLSPNSGYATAQGGNGVERNTFTNTGR